MILRDLALTFTLCSLVCGLVAAANVDSTFVQTAIRGNNAEIAQAALQMDSADYRVRQFAGRVTTDHKFANQQIVAIANRKGIDTSAAPPQPQPETTGNVHGRPNAPNSGKATSPAAYFRNEITLHRKAIAAYQKEASSGGDPQIRAYARQQLPVLKKHLQLAQTYLKQEQQRH
jgi:putative membrane protein